MIVARLPTEDDPLTLAVIVNLRAMCRQKHLHLRATINETKLVRVRLISIMVVCTSMVAEIGEKGSESRYTGQSNLKM